MTKQQGRKKAVTQNISNYPVSRPIIERFPLGVLAVEKRMKSCFESTKLSDIAVLNSMKYSQMLSEEFFEPLGLYLTKPRIAILRKKARI